MKRLIGGLVGGGLAIFGGVSALGDDTTRDESGDIIESGGLGVLAINVGDCLQLPVDQTLVQSVEGVPCGTPHDAQVYAEFDLPGGDFPGLAAVDEQASEGCYQRWGAAVGTIYEQDTELDFTLFSPVEQGWAAGDREVQCMIVTISGMPLVGDRLG